MPNERVIFAILWALLGIALGAYLERYVQRHPRLSALRWVAFAFVASCGMYAAALQAYMAATASPPTIVHHAFVGCVIVLVTLVAARLAGDGVVGYGKRVTGSAIQVSLFVNVVEALVLLLGGLIVLDYLGISVTPILTAFGVGGLAVALALQNTLANFFAGVQIAASRQLHTGDVVKLDSGYTGIVIDINWRNTVIEDVDGNRIIVPNEKLAAAVFTRFRTPLRVDVPLLLDRDVPVGRVADVARETAEAIQKSTGSTHGDVGVAFSKISDSNLEMVVTLRADRPVDQERMQSDFRRAFLERFPKSGSPN